MRWRYASAFFFSNIKKHLDFMDVRNLTVNIYLSNGKLCPKRLFKASYFRPTRIPYIKEKVHTAVCRGGLYSGRHFVALRNLALGLLSTHLSARSSVNILLSYCALQTIHKMLGCEDEIHSCPQASSWKSKRP